MLASSLPQVACRRAGILPIWVMQWMSYKRPELDSPPVFDGAGLFIILVLCVVFFVLFVFVHCLVYPMLTVLFVFVHCLVYPMLTVLFVFVHCLVYPMFFVLFVFVHCLVYPMLTVFLDYLFLIAPSVFSNVYLIYSNS